MFFPELTLHVLGALWGIYLYRSGKFRALRSGIAMALLDFPLEYLNDRFGPFWRISPDDTVLALRIGMPVEMPLIFFLAASAFALFLRPAGSTVLGINRSVAAALAGGVGALAAEAALNRVGVLEWVPPWDWYGVLLLYGGGAYLMCVYHDLRLRPQIGILIALLALAILTFPGS